jgi:hypothetical protein
MRYRVSLFVASVAVVAVVGFLVVGVRTSAVTPEGSTYVGSAKCRKCHAKELRQWKKTPHAEAFEILTAVGKEADPECVKCHSTGYGEDTGFVDHATTPELAGVGCEMCHGESSEHILVNKKDVEQGKATIAMPAGPCVKCHNPHLSRDSEIGKDALPVLRKKLEKLQARIAALEAE